MSRAFFVYERVERGVPTSPFACFCCVKRANLSPRGLCFRMSVASVRQLKVNSGVNTKLIGRERMV